MSTDADFQAVQVEARPAAIDERRAAPIQLLDGGEIVELSVKPSAWFVLIVSLRFVVVTVLAAGVLMGLIGSESQWQGYVGYLATLAVLTRVTVASLQWASRVYVLTNRRVMRMAGVLAVELEEFPLTQVRATRLEVNWLHRLLRCGSIHIAVGDDRQEGFCWDHVAGAEDVYGKITRAVRRAQGGPSQA